MTAGIIVMMMMMMMMIVVGQKAGELSLHATVNISHNSESNWECVAILTTSTKNSHQVMDLSRYLSQGAEATGVQWEDQGLVSPMAHCIA